MYGSRWNRQREKKNWVLVKDKEKGSEGTSKDGKMAKMTRRGAN
jgi:hypothetical protein